MDWCDCVGIRNWREHEYLMKFHKVSDTSISIVFFCTPFVVTYFVKRYYRFFTFKWIFLQLCVFFVFGSTHFINLWIITVDSKAVFIAMAIAKVLTAIVSCITALMLVHIIPDLLNVKTSEMFFKRKAEEFDRQIFRFLAQEETAKDIQILINKIRSTVDKHTILRTTVTELAKVLTLEECSLWMPSRNSGSYHLELSCVASNNQVRAGASVPVNLLAVIDILRSSRVVQITDACPLAAKTGRLRETFVRRREALAVRVAVLRSLVSNFQVNELSGDGFGILVVILPSTRKWREHEIELVEIVADQVSVALSHSTILEEHFRLNAQIIEENSSLELFVLREAKMDQNARSDFLSITDPMMRTPLTSLTVMSAILLETELSPEKRIAMEKVLKSTNLLETVVEHVLEVSRLDNGSFMLNLGPFNLRRVLKEVIDMLRPVALVKNIALYFVFARDLPSYATGDSKKLMQIMLNVLGNAVKFTREGYVSVTASTIMNSELSRDSSSKPSSGFCHREHFYLHVQVKDSGCGIDPEEVPFVFTKFMQNQNRSCRSNAGSGAGLGLAITERLVNLMGGQIWIESEGPENGCKATFIVKLGKSSMEEEDDS